MVLVVSLLVLGQAAVGPPPPLPVALTLGNQAGLSEKQADALLDSLAEVVKAQGFLVTKAPPECDGKRECAKAFAAKSGQAAFINVGLAAGLTQTLVDIEAISTKTDATLLQQNFSLKKKEEARDLKLALTGLGATLRATLAAEKAAEVKPDVVKPDDKPKDVVLVPKDSERPTPAVVGLSGQQTTGLIIGGVGVASLVASLALVIAALHDTSFNPMGKTGWEWTPPAGVDKDARNGLLNGALVTSILGALATGTGIALFATSPAPAQP